MTSHKTATRRRYSLEFKAQITSECDVPGASVAKVARSHGTNTNVVHGWRKLAREGGGSTSLTSREFVPITVEPNCVPSIAQRDIEVELRRGTVTMKVIWPLSAAGDFAAWTRELLR